MPQPKQTPRPLHPTLTGPNPRTIRLRRPSRICKILITSRHILREVPRIIIPRQRPLPRIRCHTVPAIAGAFATRGRESIADAPVHEPGDVQELVEDGAGLVGDVGRAG